MAKSTESKHPVKSPKPYPGFPLTPHPSGRWCKKIRGRLHYFGKLAEPEAALERFNLAWPYLKDGRAVRPLDSTDVYTLRMLCNEFLTNKKNKLDAGELSPRTWQTHYQTCKTLLAHFGPDQRVDDLRPDDFVTFRGVLAKRYGVVGLHNAINCVRGVFKFALEQEKIEKPVRYGQSLDRPSKRTLRKAREEAGERLFTSKELHQLLDAADPQIRAMIMLGLNAGFGNSDVANLPRRSVDLASAWLRFPRPKTGIQRRIPLWPETVDALRKAAALRPDAQDPADAGLVFLTRTGKPWVRVQPRRRGNELAAIVALDALSQAFRKLLKKLDINGRRGLGFYTLRHVFETVAGEAKDQVAVDAIMGHVDPSMGAQYRERISDERLRAVVEHVRNWLFHKESLTVRATAQWPKQPTRDHEAASDSCST